LFSFPFFATGLTKTLQTGISVSCFITPVTVDLSICAAEAKGMQTAHVFGMFNMAFSLGSFIVRPFLSSHSASSILTLPTLSSLLTGSHRRRSDRQCCQNPHRLDDPGDPFVGLERAEFAGGAVVGRRSAETAEGDRWSGRGTNGRSVETKRNGSRYFRRFSDRMQRKLVLISKQECLNIEMLSRLFAHRACSQV
jgi:hypothetical protein